MTTYIQRLRSLRANDSAQALVEFVVVIPIVLLMFFATIQTGIVAQCAQLSSYAAFAAARSYATSYSQFKAENNNNADTAHDEAQKRAKQAATLIMAPVSHAQKGEGLDVLNRVRSVSSSLNVDLLMDAMALVEGYAVATFYRIKDFEISKPANDTSSKSTITCSFEYWVPISVPGLTEIWNYLDFSKNENRMRDYVTPDYLHALGLSEEINEGLEILKQASNIPGVGAAVAEVKSEVENLLDRIMDTGYFGSTYNIHVSANCKMGFEPWSGTPSPGSEAGKCDASIDPEVAECLEDYDRLQKELKELESGMSNACHTVEFIRGVTDVPDPIVNPVTGNPNPRLNPPRELEESDYVDVPTSATWIDDDGDSETSQVNPPSTWNTSTNQLGKVKTQREQALDACETAQQENPNEDCTEEQTAFDEAVEELRIRINLFENPRKEGLTYWIRICDQLTTAYESKYEEVEGANPQECRPSPP